MEAKKPTLRLAALQGQGTKAQQLFDVLHGTPGSLRWWAQAEGEGQRFEFFVGMPPGGQVHGALVFLELDVPVGLILRRAVWSALQRGLRRFLVLVVEAREEPELRDIKEELARDAVEQLGLSGDEVPLFYVVPRAPEVGALLSWIEQHVSYFEVPLAEITAPPAEVFRFVRKLLFEGTGRTLDNALWSDFRRGEYLVEMSSRWRRYSILHQAMQGYFDDIPELIRLSNDGDPVAMRLLSYAGSAELLPALAPDEQQAIENGRRFFMPCWEQWCLLSLGQSLLASMSRVQEYLERNSKDSYVYDEPYLLLFMEDVAMLQRLVGTLPNVPVRLAPSQEFREGYGSYSSREKNPVYVQLVRNISSMRAMLIAARERYEEITKRHGAAGALVWYGETFSVQRLAESIEEKKNPPQAWMTVLFAQTGHLFASRDEVVSWRASGGDSKYKEGVRYFFGHPIPVFPG